MAINVPLSQLVITSLSYIPGQVLYTIVVIGVKITIISIECPATENAAVE